MTYSDIILKYLEQQGDWVIGNSLANLNCSFGFLPERACRTARSLAERGLIERQEFEKNGKRVVFYRHKPKPVYTFTPDPNDPSKIIMNRQ